MGRGSELMERLQGEVVIGDGPMGTMLYKRGMPLGTSFELLNAKDPDVIKSVHRQFVVAGAELIETNSFGANAWRLREHGLEGRAAELAGRAAQLARSVAGQRVFVAGSIGPLGLKAGEELPAGADAMFAEVAAALANDGVDILLLETFVDLEEASVAYRAVTRATDLPVIVQLSPMEGGRTARGVSLADGYRALTLLGAKGFGANCGKGPREVVRAVEDLVMSEVVDDQTVLTAFPNAGFPEVVNGRFLYLTTPEYMAEVAVRFADAGVSLIGGCCGTTPDDTRAMKVALRSRKRVAPSLARERLLAKHGGRVPVSPAEPSFEDSGPIVAVPARPPRIETPSDDALDFLRAARPGAGAPPVICEIDPPKDLDIEKGLRAAAKLKDAGVRAVTIGDSPLAVMRMSCVAFGHLIQREVGIPAIVHLSCRDRNLIGTQSLVMGAHVLGLRSILAVTGDPASIGGQQGASSVYDMNSFGLVELIARLNRGENLVGEPLGQRTQFRIGVAFNPNGRRIDDQLRRLEKKARLGAHFVQTQPCYSTARVREMYERAAPTGLPIFLGILPLMTVGAARFVHNEVPGIDVPSWVIDRLKGKDKDEARAEAMRICAEQIEETIDIAHGYYLIPPFGSAKVALELMETIRAVALAKR